MDEAERCHALATPDHGRIMADGTPKQLEDALDATVVEVDTADPARAPPLIAALCGVLSATQLGARLRVLVDPRLPEPGQRLHEAPHGQAATNQRAVTLALSIRLFRKQLHRLAVLPTECDLRPELCVMHGILMVECRVGA